MFPLPPAWSCMRLCASDEQSKNEKKFRVSSFWFLVLHCRLSSPAMKTQDSFGKLRTGSSRQKSALRMTRCKRKLRNREHGIINNGIAIQNRYCLKLETRNLK